MRLSITKSPTNGYNANLYKNGARGFTTDGGKTMRVDISAEKVVELYNKGQYDELLKLKYGWALKNGVRLKEKHFSEDFITLKFLCFAAYRSGYYYDCLILMEKLFSCLPCDKDIYEPKIEFILLNVH